MTTMDICYCVLILAGAFCLVALGVLFIRTSTAIKQTGDTVEMAQDTLKRVDKILDDVNYKLDLLNAACRNQLQSSLILKDQSLIH